MESRKFLNFNKPFELKYLLFAIDIFYCRISEFDTFDDIKKNKAFHFLDFSLLVLKNISIYYLKEYFSFLSF